ncbi:MAG: hypothetical protein IJ763_08360 [Lachnospiraceae bacterium]|nr:hypothetical protein [Lachnospiraceae bacterium]
MKNTNRHLDDNGLPYLYPEYWLNPDEYKKLYSEINSIYEVQYKNKPICAHPSFDKDGSSYIYIGLRIMDLITITYILKFQMIIRRYLNGRI